MLYLSLQSILNATEYPSATKSGLRTIKFNLINRKSPYSCHPIVMREVTADVHIQFESSTHDCPLIDFDDKKNNNNNEAKAKENPKNNLYVNLRKKHWGPLVVLFPFSTSHFSSKSLLISLMLPLGFGRDLVFEDYTEDLASKTVGQPGVLYDS